MSIKEKVINESIKRIEKRLSVIEEIMEANPLSEICEGRIKAQAILKENKGDYAKISKLMEPLAAREKELFKLAKLQSENTFKRIDEKVQLESELYDLRMEKYHIDQRKAKIAAYNNQLKE